MSKILIIEDDPLVARMYQKVMGFENIDVETASNGREGLEKATKTKPGLILLDVMMPKMNGMEVLDRLKADPDLKNIPVIMLTNLSGAADAQLAIKKGAVAYMIKSEHKPKEVASKAKEYMTQADKPKAPAEQNPSEPVAAPAAPAPAAPAPAAPAAVAPKKKEPGQTS